MYVATTRFNNTTYYENEIWRLKNNYKGCIYSVPHRISKLIKPYKKIIIIEMNNDLNLITGLGCIKNHTFYNNKYKIHKDHKYNRYVYEGKVRIDRSELCINMLNHLEHLLFKTSKHQKRQRGITIIPIHRLGISIDNNFHIGCKVKKIKGEKTNTKRTKIKKKDNKITETIEENSEMKNSSSRYALTNYVKLDKKVKKVKKRGVYRCSLCGEYKKNHNCISLIYSKELKDDIYGYLMSFF